MAEKIQQFVSSSWFETNETIQPGEVKEIDFLQTSPNMFVLQNSNAVKLHVSIASIPTLTNYEFVVGNNAYGVFGRPTSTRKLYVLNTGSQVANIKVFSIKDKFDMNILKQMSATLGDVSVSTDGIVKGFQAGVSLPPGKNNIGSVSIDPEDMILFQNMGEIIDDTNTDVKAIKENVAYNVANTNQIVDLLNAINNKEFGGSGGSAGVDKHLYYINGDSYDKETVYHNNVDSITYTATSNETIYFNYLLNDGEDIHVSINDNEVLTILSGEQITDITFNLKANDVITVTGENASIRAKYYVF